MPSWGKAEFDQFYSTGAERWGRPHTRPEIKLHYHWWNILQWQKSNYAPMLYSVLGLAPGQDVVLVGCGFNATAEGLADLGVRALGTDLSAYILAEKGNTEEAEIRAAIIAAGLDPDVDTIRGPAGPGYDPLDIYLRGGRAAPQPRGWGQILDQDMRTKGSRNSVISAFNAQYPGAAIRYIITEEVLNSIPDAEADLVCSYCQAAALDWNTPTTVVHMLSPPRPGEAQRLALNWKTYAGWRAWLDANGYSGHMVLPTVTAGQQGMTFPADNVVADRVIAYAGTF